MQEPVDAKTFVNELLIWTFRDASFGRWL